MQELIIRSNHIVTCREQAGDETIDGYIHLRNTTIDQVGWGEVPAGLLAQGIPVLDARGKTVTPGLVDAHTHLVHAGSREMELSLKLQGVPYLEILRRGGGILRTVRDTRRASREELKAKAAASLDRMLQWGTTTVEAKSGYGLELATELRCLEVARELDQEHPVDIVSTFMGAHALPEEYRDNRRGYLELLLDQVMPQVAQAGVAEFIDIFCEEGVFSVAESREILTAGRELGWGLKIHADEISPLGGAELAGELGAVSAEHLLAASSQGLAAMAAAGVTAVLLPGTSFYLRLGKYAPARAMLDLGIRVAIATDYNPGSCPTENLQGMMIHACLGLGMLPGEIIRGMTLNAAYALGRQEKIGSLEAGKQGDLVVFTAPNLDYLVYHYGINHVAQVIKKGEVVFTAP